MREQIATSLSLPLSLSLSLSLSRKTWLYLNTVVFAIKTTFLKTVCKQNNTDISLTI